MKIYEKPVRPILIEKREYKPNLLVEEFIVPLLRFEIEQVLNDLPVDDSRNLKVLDIGCGGQPFRGHCESLGLKYYSTDAQDPLSIVDFVCEIDKELHPGLIEESPFDFLLCTEVLEHVADWHTAFQNFNRLLASNGILLISCPHFYILHEQPYDFWRPTVHGIHFFANKYDFEVIKLEKIGNVWDVLGTLSGAIIQDSTPKDNALFKVLINKIIKAFFKFVFLSLKRIKLHNYITAADKNYPIYLSNLALLRKK